MIRLDPCSKLLVERIRTRAAIFGLFLAATATAAAQEVSSTAAPGLVAHLETPKEAFALGEPIPLRFIIENTGPAPIPIEIGGDSRGAPRAMRYLFQATSESGVAALDPFTGETVIKLNRHRIDYSLDRAPAIVFQIHRPHSRPCQLAPAHDKCEWLVEELLPDEMTDGRYGRWEISVKFWPEKS